MSSRSLQPPSSPATVFGVTFPQLKAELERRQHHPVNAGTLSDAAIDRLVAAIGAERVLAAVDRATQPPLPLQAAEVVS